MSIPTVAIEILYKSVTEAKDEVKRLHDEMRALNSEYISLKVDKASAQHNLNEIRDDLRALHDAATIAKRALELDPDNSKAKADLAEINAKIDETTAKLHEAQRAYDLFNEALAENANQRKKASEDAAAATEKQTAAEEKLAEAVRLRNMQEDMAMEKYLADQDAKRKAAEEAAQEEQRWARVRQEERDRLHQQALEQEKAEEEARKQAEQAELERQAEIAHVKQMQEEMAIERYLADQDLKRKADEEELARQKELAEERKRAEEEAQQQIERRIELINTLGDAIQKLGSLSQFTSEFANGIGNAFSSMAGLFNTDIGRYFTASLTHQFAQSLVGNISNVTSRYDILSTFLPYMEIAGVDNATAQALQDRINKAILGLPIGLDEATQRFRRYNMYLNDPERAANLTIGIQNALMAGGSGESYRNQAYNMIERMLATGTLTNIRQWQSLLVGLGVSQRYIEQELGLEQGTLLENIRAKTVSVDEFLAALERLGTGATEAAQGLNSALDIYKSTLESWLSNIEFAVTRGNEKVLRAFNDTIEAVTGKGITGYMEIYRDFLNDLFGSAAEYIRNNPGRVEQVINMFEGLLATLGRFSISGAFENMLDYLQILSDIVTSLLSQIPPGELEKFVAFATTLAGPLGQLFSAVANGGPAMIAIFERFKDFNFNLLVDSIVKNADTMARLIETVLDLFSDEALANIIGFGLVWGMPVATALNAIGGAIKIIGTALVTGNGAAIISFFHELAALGSALGLPAIIGATGAIGIPAAIMTAIKMRVDANEYAEMEEAMGMSDYSRYSEDLSYYADNPSKFSSLEWNTYNRNRRLQSAGIQLSQANERVAKAQMAIDGLKGMSPEEQVAAAAPLYKELDDALRQQEIAQRIYDMYKKALDEYEESLNGTSVESAISGVGGITDSVEGLADAYNDAAEAAEYSIGLQVQLWGNAEETLPKIIERLSGKAVEAATFVNVANQLMQYITPENAEVINQLLTGGVDNLEQMQMVLNDFKTNGGKYVDKLVDEFDKVSSAEQGADYWLTYYANHLDEMTQNGYTKGYMLSKMLAAGIEAGSGEAARMAWKMAYDIQIAFNSITIPDYFSHFNDTNEDFTWEQPGKYATGGLIYAATGRFIPRGTDTVPAMLTPGEFVMRKQAVDTFGAAFMKSINDLNIGAAFDRLINTKLSNPRGFVNNTYNTRDDHSTHNQYIKTNNPAFAARRAGRFVRAMA